MEKIKNKQYIALMPYENLLTRINFSQLVKRKIFHLGKELLHLNLCCESENLLFQYNISASPDLRQEDHEIKFILFDKNE